MRIEKGGGLAHHHVGGLKRRIGSSDRKLDGLVLADRPIEDDPLLGVAVAFSTIQRPSPIASEGDQNTLRVHAVQNISEALPLLTDQVSAGTRSPS